MRGIRARLASPAFASTDSSNEGSCSSSAGGALGVVRKCNSSLFLATCRSSVFPGGGGLLATSGGGGLARALSGGGGLAL